MASSPRVNVLPATPGDSPLEARNLDHMVALVQTLYQSTSPGQVKDVQDALQNLQKTPQGWQIANAFLENEDPQVRFFGALTFTYKIKHDMQSLDQQAVDGILERLIYWLIRLVNARESQVVVTKLCAALVAFYLQPSHSWKRPMRQVVLSSSQKRVVWELDGLPSTTAVLRTLGSASTSALLTFASCLAEEFDKADAQSIQTHKYRERVSSLAEDIVILVEYSITTPDLGLEVSREGITCFHNWIKFAQGAWTKGSMELESLRKLTPLAIAAFGQEETYHPTVELFTDVLNSFPFFLTAENLESLAILLTSSRAQEMISQLQNGDFNNEATLFAELMIAYGDGIVQDLAQKTDDPRLRQIVFQLLGLLRCKGFAGVDDEICIPALEFWMTFTEYCTDSLFDNSGKEVPAWLNTAKLRVQSVIEICWVKIQMPSAQDAKQFDEDDKARWKGFRTDVVDLLQSCYILLGINLFRDFAQLSLQCLEKSDWIPLEATMFCLNALSDSVADEPSVDQSLSLFFGSSLFSDLTKHSHSIPATTRRTAVEMTSQYTAFLERHGEHLPAMLNFLFDSLREPLLADKAAWAIDQICSTCRKTLTVELEAFLRQYVVILSEHTIDAYVKEKVIGGIAAIIQALPSVESKIGPLSMLVQLTKADIDTCLASIQPEQTPEQVEATVDHATSALRCLHSLGKGLQVPDDVPINLEANYSEEAWFWRNGDGVLLQREVSHLLEETRSILGWHSEIIGALCDILRAGYKEHIPGLFVFKPAVTVHFVQACSLKTPELPYVLDTAQAMLGRQSQEVEAEMKQAAGAFMTFLLSVIDGMGGDTSNDPPISSSGISLAHKITERYLQNLQAIPNFHKVFKFALRGLHSPEKFPKQAAAKFWASFLETRNHSAEDTATRYFVMQQYGSQVCDVLVRQIGGEAQRSELEILAEPLKKLVFSQPMAKQWLTTALESSTFPSTKVSLEERRFWLQKVMNLRGSGRTSLAVKDFWVACRGSEFGYA